LEAGVEQTVDGLMHRFIDDIAARPVDEVMGAAAYVDPMQPRPEDATFIRTHFNALVPFISNMEARRNTFQTPAYYQSAVDNTLGPIFGMHFRERAPMSPELEAFLAGAVRDIMRVAHGVISGLNSSEQERLWPMFSAATRRLHQEDPLSVIDQLVEQAGLTTVRNALAGALTRFNALQHQALRSNRDGHLERGRQLAEALDAVEDLTRRLAESQTALAGMQARLQADQQAASERARQHAESAVADARTALMREHEEKQKELREALA
jgi:hypothetical protein